MKISAIILRQSAEGLPRSLSQFSPYFVGKLIGRKSCFVVRIPTTKRLQGIIYQDGKIISLGIPQQNEVKFI